MSKVYQSKLPKYAGHTAGPWKPRKTKFFNVPDDLQYLVVATDKETICRMTASNGPDGRDLAMPDAALIADAPYLACEVERLRGLCGELVGVLTKVYEVHGDGEFLDDLIDEIGKALVKAKGGDE